MYINQIRISENRTGNIIAKKLSSYERRLGFYRLRKFSKFTEIIMSQINASGGIQSGHFPKYKKMVYYLHSVDENSLMA